MNPTKVVCPKCQHEFSPSEAYSHQIEETLRKKLAAEKEEELSSYRKKMRAWEEEKEAEFKAKAENIKKQALEDQNKENKLLKEELEQKNKAIIEARENEIKIRREKNELEEAKKSFELEKLRQLDEERQKIKEEAAKQVLEEQRFKDAEKDKKMADMAKMIEDLKLKSELTSQQLQGEVMELELEEFLKKEFPLDEIKEVGKGIRGADVMQVVSDQMNRPTGTIIWESKRTKTWDEAWVTKLKDDMRTTKSDIAILVTSILPKGIKYFGFKDGIIVTCFDCLVGVAAQARFALIKESQLKNSLVGAQEKKDYVMQYLQSNQFRQRVEAIIEAFSTLKEELDKEKRLYANLWAKREKQIEQVINNTVGMYGDMQGLMGSSLPQIASLEITTTETVEDLTSGKVYTKQTSVVADNFDQVNIDKLVTNN